MFVTVSHCNRIEKGKEIATMEIVLGWSPSLEAVARRVSVRKLVGGYKVVWAILHENIFRCFRYLESQASGIIFNHFSIGNNLNACIAFCVIFLGTHWPFSPSNFFFSFYDSEIMGPLVSFILVVCVSLRCWFWCIPCVPCSVTILLCKIEWLEYDSNQSWKFISWFLEEVTSIFRLKIIKKICVAVWKLFVKLWSSECPSERI